MKIKKKEVNNKSLSFNKTITFDNVKTKIEVDKYVKIENTFYEISENTINYNGTIYTISDNLVNVTRLIPIEYVSSKKKPYCIYDIDSFVSATDTTNGTFTVKGMVNSVNGLEGTLDVSYVVIA